MRLSPFYCSSLTFLKSDTTHVTKFCIVHVCFLFAELCLLGRYPGLRYVNCALFMVYKFILLWFLLCALHMQCTLATNEYYAESAFLQIGTVWTFIFLFLNMYIRYSLIFKHITYHKDTFVESWHTKWSVIDNVMEE
jgi:hypothetical protein